MERLKQFVGKLGVGRLVVLAATVLSAVGLAGWLLVQVNQPDYALLYAGLDLNESAKVVAQLDQAKIPYRLEANGATILVAKDQVGRTRVALAEHGLPSGGSIGYEIFDQNDALGSTNFVQNVKLARALEGELVRTIRSLDRVKGARVHIVLPRRDVLGRDRETPSASVVLQMQGNAPPTPTQTHAIQQLVAAAIPNLAPSRVSIVDGQGTLMTESADGEDGAVAAGRADERRRAVEKHLVGTIEQLLARVVGPGRVRAEASADMDFDRVNTNEEIFDPDGQVARSTQSIADQTNNSENTQNQPVTVANNLPDANANTAGAGAGSASQQKRNEETVNYEISKKVISHVRESGVVKRLSVAVLIDGNYTTDADGKRTYQPRPQEELDRLTTLVRGAVGYDEKRGDKVEVVNMRFAGDDALDEPAPAALFGFEKTDILRLAQYLGTIVVALLVLLTVVRPVVSRTIAAFPTSLDLAGAAALGGRGRAAGALPGVAGGGGGGALAAGSGSVAALGQSGAAGALAAPSGEGFEESEEMINLERVDGRVRASSMKRVGEIVEKHPEESLAIIRNWLHAEE